MNAANWRLTAGVVLAIIASSGVASNACAQAPADESRLEWKIEYWERQTKAGDNEKPDVTRELPKDAKLLATIIVYRTGKSESVVETKLPDKAIKLAIVPDDVDPMLGPMTRISFYFLKEKIDPRDSKEGIVLIGAGMLNSFVNKEIELGKRKVIRASGATPGQWGYVTLTVSKTAKSLDQLLGADGERSK
jgi:hypothetical protein